MKKSYTVVAALILNSKKEVLIQLRPEGKPAPNFWEFVGGKIEVGEKLWQGLKREVVEEIGVEINIGDLIWSEKVVYEDSICDVYIYYCDISSGEPKPLVASRLEWVDYHILLDIPFVPGKIQERLYKTIERICEGRTELDIE